MQFSVEINRQKFDKLFASEEEHYKGGLSHMGAGEA